MRHRIILDFLGEKKKKKKKKKRGFLGTFGGPSPADSQISQMTGMMEP